MDHFVIPEGRLPPGFAETVDHIPAVPAEPSPAATAVLMRDSETQPEVLLLKRHRSSGFVPGAYVFPGGRVDAADAGVSWSGPSEPPAEYWIAAVREIFEETGVLLARAETGDWSPDTTADAALAAWRLRLLNEEATLQDLLTETGLSLDPGEIRYIAHWITPIVEPRRYDTRFFLARLPEHREVVPDAREMDDAVWVTARSALHQFETGTLQMVFPTVKTLQMLTGFHTVSDALDAFRETAVKPIMPRLVRTPEGVGIVIDQDG